VAVGQSKEEHDEQRKEEKKRFPAIFFSFFSFFSSFCLLLLFPFLKSKSYLPPSLFLSRIPFFQPFPHDGSYLMNEEVSLEEEEKEKNGEISS